MRRSYTNLFIVTAATLVNLIWLADNISYRADWENAGRFITERRAHGAELWARYECWPRAGCTPDFDGDGVLDEIYVHQFHAYDDNWLVVNVGGREVLRLAYADGESWESTTRVAVLNVRGRSRLVVYDGASYAVPLSVVYAWDGREMVTVEPLDGEQKMLELMANRDGRERPLDVALENFRRVRVGIYFVTLSGLLGVALYWKLSARQRLP